MAIYIGDNNSNTYSGTDDDDNIYGAGNPDTLSGLGGNDYITGGSGFDTLIGGTGNDTLDGNDGSDTYVFALGDGQDKIVVYDGLDVMKFTNVAATDVSSVIRSSFNLILNYGSGDSLTIGFFFNGYSVNSYYVIDNFVFTGGVVWGYAALASHTVIQGTADHDNLFDWDGYASVLEGMDGNDHLYGGSGTDSDTLNGGAGEDTLSASNGNDLLDGGTGADSMVGGAGNDSYVVDIAGDTVTESAGEGVDTVSSSISYTLGNNLEKLVLTGNGIIDGTGNKQNNTLTGNGAANKLNGGSGADSMAGGGGSDTYQVDNVSDSVTELLNSGVDSVNSSVSFTLASNVEKLTLTGNASINGTGNTLANTLVGNGAANKLDGGLGADSMTGGNGGDIYVVDNIGDNIVELANAGIDTVNSALSYTLGNDLENLVLTGIQAINGTGNALNNSLKGNGAANSLTGGSGSDTLNGGNGKDVLIGGLGKDKIVLAETAAATDTVKIANGDSKVIAYDTVTGFALGNGLVTKGADQLDLTSIVMTANTVGVDGVNAGAFLSHAVNNGIISFDDADVYGTALTLTAGALSNVFSYLQNNIKASETVAFNALGNTYVFQDGGVNDTLVQLTGITATNLNTSGLVVDGVWLV